MRLLSIVITNFKKVTSVINPKKNTDYAHFQMSFKGVNQNIRLQIRYVG